MGKVNLSIDTGQLIFVNNNKENVTIWTQYEECYKCPFNFFYNLAFNQSIPFNFHSYYTLQYKIVEPSTASVDDNVLCEGNSNLDDQSISRLIISTQSKSNCTFETLQSGRNNLWPFLVAILVLIFGFAAFYLIRFVYRKMTNSTNLFEDESEKVSQRLKSLDSFRGLTILSMIFVNWGAGEYYTLDHAEWDGIHFADFIFPFFIFILGITMAISLRSQIVKKEIALKQIYKSIVLRSCKLLIIGLILNSVGRYDLRYLRIPGVLQRFAISYLLVASTHAISLFLNKNKLYSQMNYLSDILPYWPDWIVAIIMFILYFSLTFGWKFDPNCPRGYLGPGGLYENASNPHCIGGAANKLDKLIFGENHIYQHFTGLKLYDPNKQFNLKHDPEGALGVTSSILLTFIGLQVGKIFLTYSSPKQRLTRWAVWALVLAVLAGILAGTGAIPINKNLWSFTFVCVTGASGIVLFIIFYMLIDQWRFWPSGQPFHYPGMNSILLYIGHSFTGDMLPFFYTSSTSSHAWPLTQNITGVLLWFLISVYLAKKSIFFSL